MSKKESKIFYGWWIVLVCTLGLFVAYGARLYSFGVFFKPMVKEFGWTRTQTSSAFGVSTILYGVISPFVGKIVDKYGARFVIAIGGFIGGIGFMLCYFTNTLTQFFIFYTVIMTVGISMTGMVSTNAGVVKWFTKKRATAMGIVNAGASLGAVFLAPLAQWMVSNFGWRLSFVYMGLIVWIPLVPLSLLILRNDPRDIGLLPDGATDTGPVDNPAVSNPNSEPQAAAVKWTLKEAMAGPAFWLLSISFFIYLGTYMSIAVHIVPYGTDQGHSRMVAAFGISIITGIGVLAKLAGGWLGDRISLRNLMLLGFIAMIVDLVVFPNLLGIKNVIYFYTFAVLMGVGFGFVWPLVPAWISRLYGVGSMGIVWGGVVMIGTLGGGIGPICAGKVYDIAHSYSLFFLIGALVLAIGAALLFFIKPPVKKEVAVLAAR